MDAAEFASALTLPDSSAPAISQQEAQVFVANIHRTCDICTRTNVKSCTLFIKQYVFGSSSRTSALASFLLSLSKSFAPDDTTEHVNNIDLGSPGGGLTGSANGALKQPPVPAFKRLHILYILHDALVHAQAHPPRNVTENQDAMLSKVLETLYPTLLCLLQLAACGCTNSTAKTAPALLDLISLWTRRSLFSPAQLSELQTTIHISSTTTWSTTLSHITSSETTALQTQRRLATEKASWIIPARHSCPRDSTAPWHELPAANGLYMRRKHGFPLYARALPPGGFPLPDAGHLASESLQKDVLNLYTDILHCYDKYTAGEDVQDIDACGNVIWEDPERPTRNYWGFTVDGIEKRRELARGFEEGAVGYEGLGGREMGVDDAVERARRLAMERTNGGGIGGGRGRGGDRREFRAGERGGWRGGRGRGRGR